MAQLHTLLNSEIQEHEIQPFKMAKQMFRQCMNAGKFIAIHFALQCHTKLEIHCSPNREKRGGIRQTETQFAS